ncbi:MAG: dockerin type I repeat-containing protein, partial [Ruminococcus sp.]|nr:dockerin type I repeat-containing protein [Ruminococcus sp.]
EFADTFTISGKRQQKEIKVTVTDSAKSYSGVTAEKSSETVTESTIPGDVTGDGKVTIDDATEIQKYLADLTDFTPEQIEAADTYGDGIITIDDATMIQKLVAGMIDSF